MLRLLLALALCACTAASASPTDDAKAANVRGMKLYSVKKYADAAKEFRAAIAANPKFVLAHYNLASMAALLDDKPTVLAELRWLHDSTDPEARKALDKAPSDPDLHGVIDDPEVKKLLAGGMSADARARMQAWLTSPLLGNDNDVARMREVKVIRDDEHDAYAAHIKNQFGFTCALVWAADGGPKSLDACVSDQQGWRAEPAQIPLTCKIDKKHKVDHCEGHFHLLNAEDFDQDGRFVLERKLH